MNYEAVAAIEGVEHDLKRVLRALPRIAGNREARAIIREALGELDDIQEDLLTIPSRPPVDPVEPPPVRPPVDPVEPPPPVEPPVVVDPVEPPARPPGEGMPEGYSLVEHEADYVVAGFPLGGGEHPVQSGLRAMEDHPAFPFPSGSNVAICLPAGTYEDFGINTQSGLISYGSNVTYNPGTWGNIHIHLAGPTSVPRGHKALVIEAHKWMASSGDTISIQPDMDWPAWISFHHMEIRSTGRKCIGHASKNKVDPNHPFSYPASLVAGTRLGVYNCLLTAHSQAPRGGATAGHNQHQAKWGIHAFRTSVFAKGTDFLFDDLDEHAIYEHHSTPFDGGMDDCTFRGIGGQLFQQTCRDQLHPTSAAWNTAQTYEGNYHGHAWTKITNIVCENEFNLVQARASCAFAMYGTGRSLLIENVHLRSDMPADQREVQPVHAEDETKGFLRAGPQSFYNTQGVNYHRQRTKFPAFDSPKGFIIQEVRIQDSTFVWGSNGNVEPCQIASVFAGLTVDNCAFLHGPGPTPGTAMSNSGQIRLAEENANGGSQSRVHGNATSDIKNVVWTANNTDITMARALEVFPDLTPAQTESEMYIIEGAESPGKPGIFRGSASVNHSRDFKEYPQP